MRSRTRIGWISQPALNYICRRLAVAPAEAYGVATFYALFATTPRPPVVAHVCDDIACRLAGAEELCDDLERTLGPAGAPAATAARPGCAARAWGCATGRRPRCSRSPASDRAFAVAPVDAAGIVARLAADGERTATCSRPMAPGQGRWPGQPSLPRPSGSSRGSASSIPASLDDYRANGGYAALARAFEIGPRGGDRRGDRLEADGSRRRGLPDRPQVGGRRRPAGAAALPRLQRRRVGARHVQGSGPARGRPVRRRRGDDHRRLRDRRCERLPLHPRRVPGGRGARPGARSTQARAAGLLGQDILGSGFAVRHRAPARRRRLHLRRGDGAVRVDRGQARRAAQQAAVPGRGRAVRQADGRQQRRDAGQRPADRAPTAAPRSPRSGPRARPARSCSACRATSPGPGATRSSSGRRCAS